MPPIPKTPDSSGSCFKKQHIFSTKPMELYGSPIASLLTYSKYNFTSQYSSDATHFCFATAEVPHTFLHLFPFLLSQFL